jgi:hypothetical protein
MDNQPTNRHDARGIVPIPHALAKGGFQGAAPGGPGYQGERLASVGAAPGITVEAIPSSGYSPAAPAEPWPAARAAATAGWYYIRFCFFCSGSFISLVALPRSRGITAASK